MAATCMNKNSDTGREQAVSEVIGAIMLISVVVVAVAVLGVALTSQGTPQKIPALDAVISNYGRTIQIYHNGGDPLQSTEMAILVDGIETPFVNGNNPSWTSWSAGESLSYNVPGTGDMPDIVRIVYHGGDTTTVLTTADFRATGMINDGPLPTPTPDVGPVKASLTGIPVSGTAPLVVQFTGSSTGTPTSWLWGFGDGGTSFSQSPLYTFTNTGTYTVSLTVSNGTGSDTQIRTNYITVSPAGPVANFVGNPQSGPVPLTVYFTDTSTGTPTSWLWEFGDGATNTFQHPSHAYLFTGIYTVNLTATNAGGSNKTSKAGYISTSLSGPTVTAISPSSSLQANPVSVTVAGSGFLSGANVTLVKAGQTERIATSVNVVSGNLITCQFNLLTAALGPWDVKVNNTNDQSGTLASGFTVKSPTPTVTAITNATGVRGWTVVERITGTNFLSGADVRLVNASAGPDITANNVVVMSATQINCSFDLTGAAPAQRNVTVKNLYSDTGTFANSFTVTSNAPTVTVFAPTSGNCGWPLTLTSITGTGFQPGAQVRLTSITAGQPDIIASGATVTSPTTISGSPFDLLGVFVPTTPAAGGSSTWRVNVTNTFDGRSGSAATFTVNSNRPTITGITPNTAPRGTTVSITNLAGTLFQPGATIQLRNATQVISTGTSVTVVSPTQITCQFTIPSSGVTPGTNLYYINVTNTDTRTRNSGNIFSIT
jgi:PKD repeat protein